MNWEEFARVLCRAFHPNLTPEELEKAVSRIMAEFADAFPDAPETPKG